MMNPSSQPCRTCQHFNLQTRHCQSLDSPVLPHWTGCVRWTPVPGPPTENA